jgi:hypothetical protein
MTSSNTRDRIPDALEHTEHKPDAHCSELLQSSELYFRQY